MKLLSNYIIAETEYFKSKILGDKFKRYYHKIYNFVYPQLRINPFFGPNIKRLKGEEYKDVFRYRIGKIRIFYVIKESEVIVIMTDINYRKDVY